MKFASQTIECIFLWKGSTNLVLETKRMNTAYKAIDFVRNTRIDERRFERQKWLSAAAIIIGFLGSVSSLVAIRLSNAEDGAHWLLLLLPFTAMFVGGVLASASLKLARYSAHKFELLDGRQNTHELMEEHERALELLKRIAASKEPDTFIRQHSEEINEVIGAA